MFRNLIRKQLNDKLRIHRVLYFLPHRGPLELADACLQEEIEVMHHFFGNAIFDCMVLIYTLHKRYQRCGFSEEDSEDTRKIFEKALKLAPIVGDRPECPPVLFIGLDDAGKDILHRIKSAAVLRNEGLILDKFVHGTCTRCAAKRLCYECKPNDPDNQIGVAIPVKGGEEKNEVFVPYQSSQCHPLFIPKFSFWEKVAGGAAHVATLGIPMIIQMLRKREIPWPTFTSDDEMCANCNQSPGSQGCMEVRSKYTATLPTGITVGIIVDHTNLMEDDYFKFLDISYK